MSQKRTGKMWVAGSIVLLAALATAMFFVTKGARVVAKIVRQGMIAPGPPVARADLPRLMGDVPLAPFFALDEPATNDPTLRLQAGMALGHGKGEWILVFRSAEPYSTAAVWYRRQLAGWNDDQDGGSSSRSERERNGILQTAWYRDNDRVMLAYLPEHPGQLLLFVSSPPPRKRT
jgi:hypothetical protein